MHACYGSRHSLESGGLWIGVSQSIWMHLFHFSYLQNWLFAWIPFRLFISVLCVHTFKLLVQGYFLVLFWDTQRN
ncbi:hypothetical protein QBC46DRAFT_378473 [Diplogelasinospora grovesii]|uniref:Uncharacterized protein n=1 Tax=Diplogelasinospora grovesii TaxID=303347 RepID=A0AAN6S7E1_9PEZI|nr:hypothetical protein QBC46DRAFT_378473 [Diplogelasinospora grovesii]